EAGDPTTRTPMVGIFGCCAAAPNDARALAAPTNPMNSRRLICAPLYSDRHSTSSNRENGSARDVRVGSPAGIRPLPPLGPLKTGGLNRSTQHFILKERWSGVLMG